MIHSTIHLSPLLGNDGQISKSNDPSRLIPQAKFSSQRNLNLLLPIDFDDWFLLRRIAFRYPLSTFRLSQDTVDNDFSMKFWNDMEQIQIEYYVISFDRSLVRDPGVPLSRDWKIERSGIIICDYLSGKKKITRDSFQIIFPIRIIRSLARTSQLHSPKNLSLLYFDTQRSKRSSSFETWRWILNSAVWCRTFTHYSRSKIFNGIPLVEIGNIYCCIEEMWAERTIRLDWKQS